MKTMVTFLAIIGVSLNYPVFASSRPHQGTGRESEQKSRARLYTYQFEILGMSCDGCAKSSVQALKKAIPDVVSVTVDFKTKKGKLVTRSPVQREQIREALGALGFEPRFPNEPPPPEPLPEDVKAHLDIKTISNGEAVELKDFLVRGKYTIFDFYAEWCGPCHLLSPKLERLVQKNPNVALRIINISDWESPAAKQATKKYTLPGLPYVRVYGPDGTFIGAVHGNHFNKIVKLIQKGK